MPHDAGRRPHGPGARPHAVAGASRCRRSSCRSRCSRPRGPRRRPGSGPISSSSSPSGRASSRSPAVPAAPASTARCRWSAAIQDRFGVPVAAHMTCAWSSREEIDELARDYWQPGVRRIVALRGDPPKGSDRYAPRADGYAYAADLIAGLKARGRFRDQRRLLPGGPSRGRECRGRPRQPAPQGRGRAPRGWSPSTASTPTAILRFRDRLAAAGIEAEYVPGIMPIHNFTQIKRFSQGCGAGIPAWLERLFDGRGGELADARHDRRQRRRRAVPPARRRGPDPDARLRAEPGRAAAGHPPPPWRAASPHPELPSPAARNSIMADFLDFARRRVVLLDGAMGSQIQARDLTLDDFWGQENCSEILNLSRPDLIREHPPGLSRGRRRRGRDQQLRRLADHAGRVRARGPGAGDQRARGAAGPRGGREPAPATAGSASSSAPSAPAPSCRAWAISATASWRRPSPSRPRA